MALSESDAIEQFRSMEEIRDAERPRLDQIHDYLRDEQELSWLPSGVPAEVRQLARVSRVNMLKNVVNSVTQAMYVDGIRAPRMADNEPVWDIWQRNRMDSRQIGIHRAGTAYGAAYSTVLPGEPVPVIRGSSPRHMTVAYADDDDWPAYALEQRRDGTFRMLDETHAYIFRPTEDTDKAPELLQSSEHGVGVCPVVRYRDTEDLDDEVIGEVEPLLHLQDQINITTFGLMVAQHYGAFRQRYILGWMAETEEQKLKASASQLWTFEDSPQDVQVGEFSQTDLSGYINSRESTLRHLATVSQTPAHELLGQLVNLSAEALAAANDSHRSKVIERQTVMGESHEQTLGLAGDLIGEPVEPSAYVRWKDTEPRSMAQMADALGKLAQNLNVPVQELWEMVPDVSQQQVQRWKRASQSQPSQPAETSETEAPEA